MSTVLGPAKWDIGFGNVTFTLFYGLYSMVVSILAIGTSHPWLALGFYLGGCGVWALVE